MSIFSEQDSILPTDGSEKISHIVILIAMDAEASPLLQSYKLESLSFKLFPQAPSILYTGSSHNDNCRITVVTNGKCKKHGVDNVGTTPAAVSAMAAIAELNPSLIINAGGFKRKGAAIGDAFISSQVANHDRRIPIPVPFLALKIVTDIVDGDRPSHEEFLENLHHAAVSLQQTLPKVIDFLAGKSLSEI
eukprot:gene32371-41942_t